jgi:hypothetical protein
MLCGWICHFASQDCHHRTFIAVKALTTALQFFIVFSH